MPPNDSAPGDSAARPAGPGGASSDRPPLTAAVLAVGSELVLGQLVDTNSAWLSRFLSARGVAVVAHESRGDDLGRLVELYRRAFELHDVVVATGGLGPTEDDLARQAAARAFGTRLVYRPDLAAELGRLIKSRGYSLSPNQRRQSWIPEGMEAIVNPWGSAPAFCLDRPGKLMMFLPGVPDEMRRISEDSLGPRLERRFSSRLGLVRTTVVRAAGLGEGLVDHLLADLLSRSENPRLGLLAGPYETRILATTRARDESDCDRIEAPVLAEIEARLGRHHVGRGGDTLAAVCARIAAERGLRLAVVDACAGGKAAEPFLATVDPRHWAGSLTTDADGIGPGLDLLLGPLGADLVAVVSGAMTPIGAETAEAEKAGAGTSGAGANASGRGDSGAAAGPRGGRVAMTGSVEIFAAAGGRARPVLRAEARSAGPRGLVAARFAALLAYHLWRHLTGWTDG